MIDQATALRKLVLQAMRESTSAAGPSPRLVALTSGKLGVGVTTLSVNLSVALAEHGARTVVVDADIQRPDVALLCGFQPHTNSTESQAARRDIHEAMLRGPAGVQIVPGIWAPGESMEWSEMAQERLLRQLRALGRHADIVLLDVGAGTNDFLGRCCRSADDVIVVTTPDDAAVMDSYARIKTIMRGMESEKLSLLVNVCSSSRNATDVHHRINQSCDRFLGIQLSFEGYVPDDKQIPEAAKQTVPFVIGYPTCPAARAIQELAVKLIPRENAHGTSRTAA